MRGYIILIIVIILFISIINTSFAKIQNDNEDNVYLNKLSIDHHHQCKEVYEYKPTSNNNNIFKSIYNKLSGNNNNNNNNNNNYCKFKKNKNDLSKSFKEYFQRYLSFQDYATNEIESIIYRKYLNRNETKVVLHFFGDHGLGKTLSSKLISRVLFENGNGLEGDGLLIINGEEYRIIEQQPQQPSTTAIADIENDKQQQQQQQQVNDIEFLNIKAQIYRNKLYNIIVNQLLNCPYSVIVLDEIQKIDPYVISVLEPFLDGTTIQVSNENDNSASSSNSKKIESKLATFILTSDFEKEGMTYYKSILELKQKAILMFKSIYGDNKFSKLITNSIPFSPLSKSNSKIQIINEIKSIFCQEPNLDILIINSKSIVSEIIEKRMNILHPNENFRAIEKILNEMIFNKVSNFIIKDLDEVINKINNDQTNQINQINNNNNNKQKEEDIFSKFYNNVKNNNLFDKPPTSKKQILFTLSIKPNQLNNNLIVEILHSINQDNQDDKSLKIKDEL